MGSLRAPRGAASGTVLPADDAFVIVFGACSHPPLTCIAPAVLPPASCAPPIVTVSTTDGASAAAAAVATALSHHYAAVLAVKGLFSKLASLSSRITAGDDSLVLLPSPCISASAKLAGGRGESH